MKYNKTAGNLRRRVWAMVPLYLLAAVIAWACIGLPISRAGATDVTFPSRLIGTSASGNITVDNSTSWSEINIDSVSLTGGNTGDFSLDAGCNEATLFQGEGDCTIGATFTPTAPGNRSATVTVAWSAILGEVSPKTGAGSVNALQVPTSGSFTATLSGVGIAPITPTPSPVPNPQGRIYGQVTFKGQPLTNTAGVTVSLNGTVGGQPVKVGPQQVDGSGKYGFNNLDKGTYTVSITTPTNVQVDGPSSFNVDMSQGVKDSQVNFNLTNQAPPPPTATPTGSGPGRNCEEGVGGPGGSVYMITCVQAAGANGVFVHYILGNNTSETVDVGHSVTFSGGSVVNLSDPALKSIGSFNGSVWNGFDLAPGAFATLRPAFQSNNGALFSSIFATVTGKTSGKVYAATQGGFTATTALSVLALKEISLPGPNCGPVTPVAGVLDMTICRAQVNPLPNGGTQYIVKVIVENGKNTTMDVSKTVVVDVAPGVNVTSVTADVGTTRTDPGTNTVTWTDYTLPPNGSATLTMVLEAPPATAGQSSTTLLNDVKLSAVEAGTGARYEGRSGVFTSTSPVLRTPAQTAPVIPGKLPYTGQTGSGDIAPVAVELGLLALILTGLGLLVFSRRRPEQPKG